MSKPVISLELSLGVYVQRWTDYYPVLVTLLSVYSLSHRRSHCAQDSVSRVTEYSWSLLLKVGTVTSLLFAPVVFYFIVFLNDLDICG